MLGIRRRPSRRELEAQAQEQRDRIDALEKAARAPRWRRVLGRVVRGPWWWRALVVVFVVVPVAVLGVGAAAGVLTVRAFLVWPRPVAAAALTGWALAGGPGGWWGVLPLSLTTAAAVWWHRRLAPPPPPPVPRPVHGHVWLWRQQVAAGDDAPVKGSHVSDDVTVVRAPDGRACGVVLHVTGADSTQTPGMVKRAAERLAYVYAVDAAAVTVRAVKGNNRRADVEILDQWWMDEQAATRSARITDVQPWAGPALADDGRFRLLTAAWDGRAAHGQLWVPGQGARPVDISGLQGSGKSNTVNVVNASVMSRGLVVMDLIDLKGGASVPAWRQTAWRYGDDVDAALLALLRFCVVIDVRTALMARMPVLRPDGQPVLTAGGSPAFGVTVLEPSAALPVYLLEIDEFPQVARLKVARKLIKRGYEQGRAALCSLATVHQGTALADGYVEGDGLVRGLATNGTTVAHRNDDTARARTMGKASQVDPDAFGLGTPGEAAMTSPAEPVPVHGRVEYLADPWDAAGRAIPGVLEEETAERVARLEAHVAEFGDVPGLVAAYEVGHLHGLTLAMQAREAARAARSVDVAPAVPGQPGLSVVSGVVGSVPVMAPDVDPVASERIVAFLRDQGAGRVLKTGEILAGAGVRSSTFTQWRQRQPDGHLIDHGHGKWAAGAALVLEGSNT